LKTVNKVFQVSDLHIRLYKRHKEYNQVFKRLFQYIQETKTEESIIFLGGDIVHNKTDMSPELIEVTSNFLKGCADILPTILIAGNHDGIIGHSARLDALTPIVNSLNHPNLHYWKDSGVYKFGGLTFSVFGIFDSREKWVNGSDIKGRYKIGLHHGPIIGSKTETQTLDSGIKLDVFDNLDIVMCGDIHKFQTLQEYHEEDGRKYPAVKYSSSLLGQNYGESVDEHGILVWNLPKRTAEFVRIKNDYGFVTFNVIDGNCNIPNDLPKNLRVRIKFENSSNQEVEEFVKRLSKKYNIVELIKQKGSTLTESLQTSEELLGNSRDVEFQNSIIREMLMVQNQDITEEEINSVLQLNLEMNKLLPITTVNRNVTWKPLKLEFSNMFSYGEENVIDFTDFKGNYGIWAKNAEGKSSIFDVLTFVLFDKSTRASKASHILNNQKSKFQCKINFELGGKIYWVERVGTKNEKTGAVKVDVNFWTIDENGEKANLNGEDRDKTNFIIREYVGTYDDFIMTSLSTQYDNQNFVEKSQRDRKELLYKFLDIFVYDDLYKLSKENSKEFQVLIREFEKENLHQRSSQVYNQIQENESKLDLIDVNLNAVKGSIKEKTEELLSLNKDFKPIDVNLDINELIDQEHKNRISIENFFQQISNIKLDLNNLLKEKISLTEQLIPLSVYSDIQEWERAYQNIQNTVREEENKLQLLDRELNECKVKQKHLDSHQYDPNCKFCVDNQFVKDAKQAIEKIPELEQSRISLLGWLDIYKNGLESSKQTLELAQEYQSVLKQLSTIDSKVQLLTEQVKTLELKSQSLETERTNIQAKKNEYESNVLLITKNNEILNLITETETQIKQLNLQHDSVQKNHRLIELEISKLKTEYSDINLKLDKYLDYLKKYRVYELYSQTVSRDGVPYKIVELVLPVLENEVNLILNSIANFTVKLEATDEKYIHAFINYGPNQIWPVELSSGMERFMLSLAFRVALTEITSLPKSCFLAIDEGFGVLDAENILQIGKLFEYLKTQYEFLICISHIDTMRDLVDKQIKINRVDGYSKVEYLNAT